MSLERRTGLPRVSKKRAAAIEAGEVRTAHNSTLSLGSEPIRKRNHARLQKLRVQQFGDDGYYEEILSTPCIVTGATEVDPAHVVKSRGAGGGPGAMAPLRHDVHFDFDTLGEEKFFAKWEVSKADIRAWALNRRQMWEAAADA